MTTIPLSLDGYTDLPPGKIANVVTYFEMGKAPEQPPLPAPDGMTVEHVDRPDPDWYRDVFRRVGENWLWYSLLAMPEAEVSSVLSDPAVEIYALRSHGDTIGVAELDRRVADEVEIVVFGVVPEVAGTGAARHLMDVVLRRAFRPGAGRVWLHTCTFDHPAAVRFYLRAGFRAFKYAIEVMDDPRLAGLLPPTAAPHVPVIRPSGD